MASRSKRFCWLAVVIAGLCAAPLLSQSRVRFEAGDAIRPDSLLQPTTLDVPATADAVIQQMASTAGIIFAGQVTAVRGPVGFAGSSADAAEGVVEVDFRVDLAVRGPAAGSIYTLREWPGLWTGNSRRYRIGQRLLVFLHAPDAHGLSSPIHGAEGALPLRGGGVAPGPDDAGSSAAAWNVDLRWVQAQVLRADRHLTLPVHGGPVYPPGLPKPGRGITPESHAPGAEARQDGDEPEYALSRRLPEPSLLPFPGAVQAEPLSQVISLCEQVVRKDAMRHRNGTR